MKFTSHTVASLAMAFIISPMDYGMAATMTSSSAISSTTTNNDLECRLLQVTMESANDDDEDDDMVRYECETSAEQEPDHRSDMTYQINLTEDFIKKHVKPSMIKSNSEDVILKISNGVAVRNDAADVLDVIEVPSDANVTIVEGSRRFLQSDATTKSWTRGEKKLLVVRLQSQDSTVTLSSEKLSGLIFGLGPHAEPVNVLSQFGDCSRGALTMVPAQGDGIVNGVANIFLNATIVGVNPVGYQNQIEALVSDQLAGGGKVEDSYDHVIYCLPKGGKMIRGYVAVAYYYNHRSFYDDEWCGRLSVLMHEIGHNIGLQHSGRVNKHHEYGDVSGYMGFAHMDFGGPRMCYNGIKLWQLEWYNERHVELDGVSRPWTGRLAPFTQYDETIQGEHYVLIKVGQYMISYNKAETYNAGTSANQNEIAIHLFLPGGSSYFVGSISLVDDNPVFTLSNFAETGHTLIIEACDFTEGEAVESFTMSIHLDDGYQMTFCRGGQQAYEFPTIAPTLTPSDVPSRISPTYLPSSPPSLSFNPSSSPTRDICEDKPGNVVAGLDCAYIARFPDLIESQCVSGKLAWDTCEDTCGRCQDNCKDKPGRFYIDERWGDRTCLWLSIRPEYVARFCKPGNIAYTLCGELCNTCEHQFWPTSFPSNSPTQSMMPTTLSPTTNVPTPAPTTDSPTTGHSTVPTITESLVPSIPPTLTPTTEEEGCNDSVNDTFLVATPRRNLGHRSCAWLSRMKVWQWILCKPGNKAYDVCPGICGKCTLVPSAMPSAMPVTPTVSPTHEFQIPTRSPAPTIAPTKKKQVCEDSLTDTFVVGTARRTIGKRDCSWLSRKVVWQQILCQPGQGAYDACPELCGKCFDNCHDESNYTFFVNDRLQYRSCRFLKFRPDLATRLCKVPDISAACRETCNSCTEEENTTTLQQNNDDNAGE
mmetsp:Transcript_11603/g.17846  ORF Transcript_11603/g.17846 Transcript_11603/m.17846 type:complete len:930 (+) Transcript_11603:317-3106(+)